MAGPSLRERARALGLVLSDHQVEAFATYRDLMLETAERFSLTALRDAEEVERRHFIESLALGRALIDLNVMPRDGRLKAIDIGSGAGIPGLPLKIAWPALDLTLLESNDKRCRFLREVIARLRLQDARVLEGRAETLAHDPAQREKYELALARAVAPLPVLLEYSLPFLAVGGVLAAPKGSGAAREVAVSGPALERLGGALEQAVPFEPPEGRAQTLVIVRKVRPILERYPRRPGVPAKRPIA